MPFRSKKPKETEGYHPEESSPGIDSFHHDDSNWLISYADMMTLLCGFFIMLFSMSKLDAPEYDSFKEAVVKQFGGKYESPAKDLAKFATQMITDLNLPKGAKVKTEPTGISITFESTQFFETLSAEIVPEGKKALTEVIRALLTKQKSLSKIYNVVVEGHTDSRPILGGVFPSNWELSGARSARVVRLFVDEGFPPDHLTAIAYADTRPEVDARTVTGQWDETLLSKNRRVVIKILEPKSEAIPLPEKASLTPVETSSAPASTSPSIPSN